MARRRGAPRGARTPYHLYRVREGRVVEIVPFAESAEADEALSRP